jgi:hypothetical protein
VELADDVDADHVAERLDDPEVRVSAFDDTSGVAEPGTRERKCGLGLPHARGTVEEEGVGVATGEGCREQPLCLGLLRNVVERSV